MNKNYKRRIILINKKFQYKMILRFLLVNFFIMLLFGGLCYLFFNSEIESNLKSAHVTLRNVRDMLLPIILTLSIINILISSIIITVFVLYASFRIAGPLYRFNEVVKEIGNRNLKPVTRIREGDQLYECSVTISETVDTLGDDFGNIKNHVKELKELMDQEAKKEIISKKVEQLEEIIGQYEV